MSRTVTEIFLWVIMASALVLIIMNAEKFATAVTAIGSNTNSLAKTLSGSGYVTAK